MTLRLKLKAPYSKMICVQKPHSSSSTLTWTSFTRLAISPQETCCVTLGFSHQTVQSQKYLVSFSGNVGDNELMAGTYQASVLQFLVTELVFIYCSLLCWLMTIKELSHSSLLSWYFCFSHDVLTSISLRLRGFFCCCCCCDVLSLRRTNKFRNLKYFSQGAL